MPAYLIEYTSMVWEEKDVICFWRKWQLKRGWAPKAHQNCCLELGVVSADATLIKYICGFHQKCVKQFLAKLKYITSKSWQ